MSLIRTETITCPRCGTDSDFDVLHSVNADRRPDLRDQVLDGSLQVEACGNCSTPFRLQPRMTYLDVGRGQWMSVQPLESLGDWEALQAAAQESFDESYGSAATASAQDVGAGLKPRLIFGWCALREKLLIDDNDLDDVALELLKLMIIRGVEGQSLADNLELRLVDVNKDGLVLAWIFAHTEEALEHMTVPRDLYDDVVGDPEAWQAIADQLSDSTFIDIQKLILPKAA